jgi:hypothetical protein
MVGRTLVIRREQMDALDAYSRATFRQRVVDHLAIDLPQRWAQLGPGGAEMLVDRCIEKGMGYGIDEEDDLQVYVDLCAELGPDFEKDEEMEWARDILLKPSLSGRAKLQLIRQLR